MAVVFPTQSILIGVRGIFDRQIHTLYTRFGHVIIVLLRNNLRVSDHAVVLHAYILAISYQVRAGTALPGL